MAYVREWLALESFEGLTMLDFQDSFTAKFSALKGKAGRQHSAGTGDYTFSWDRRLGICGFFQHSGFRVVGLCKWWLAGFPQGIHSERTRQKLPGL